MKKLLAILMALMLVMVSAFALAEDKETDGNEPAGQGQQEGTEDPIAGSTVNSPNSGSANSYLPNPADEFSNKEQVSESKPLNNQANVSVTLTKKINVEGYEKTGAAPAQYITFTATLPEKDFVTNNSVDVDKTKVPVVTFSDVNLAKEAESGNITLTIPGAYPAVGVYNYDVTETIYTDETKKTTGVAGMTAAADLKLTITVIQDQTDGSMKIAGVSLKQSGTKTDEIENLFESGALDITKTVTGNMGDRTKPFTFTVTFTSTKPVNSDISKTGTGSYTGSLTGDGWLNKEVTVTLTHEQTIEFDNIPAGVTYSVSEAAAEGYTTESSGTTGSITNGVKASASFTNDRSMTIDTGVTLETTAYMLIMALTMAGFAMMMIRRRKEY